VPSLLAVVEPHTAGDRMENAKWLNCRLNDVRERLTERGHGVSCPVISRLLKAAEYRLRLNVKEHEGEPHPDRQFEYIREQRQRHQQAGQPPISGDTKKKELVGNFKIKGQIWCQKAEAVKSRGFKQQLQEHLADGLGLTVTVCHYPPGTSTWNPIEHRLFSEISKTWAGCPLRSFDVVLDYINATQTQTGLTVQARLVTTPVGSKQALARAIPPVAQPR